MYLSRVFEVVVALLCLLVAGQATLAEDFHVYPPYGFSYLVHDGEQVVLDVAPRIWIPEWRYISFDGKPTVNAQGDRAVENAQKWADAPAPLVLKHVGRKLEGNKLEFTWELGTSVDMKLTLAAIGVAGMGRFAQQPCRVTYADGKTDDVPVPFAKGRIGEGIKALTFRDAKGKELTVRLAAAAVVSADKEARVVLGEALKANQPVKVTVTIEFPGSVKFYAQESDSFVRDDTSNWIPYSVGPAGVPFDLSFLNKDAGGKFIPAGTHGFLTVKGDQFVFEDGTPVRFWGVNCTAGAILENEKRHIQLAERLSRVGVNLVRLHHLDSWVNPIVDYNHPDGTTQHLNPASMKLLDHFIFTMKKHGIYIVLDPWVQRGFKPGDGVDNYGEGWGRNTSGGNFNLHSYIYYDKRMQELIRKQWKDVWTHVNEYTGVAHKDEPAIVMTEVINEGLFTKFSGVKAKSYQERLKVVYEQWAKENKGLPWAEADLFKNNYSTNNIRFLTHLHRKFYREAHDYLRSIGVRVPINHNNWAHWTWVLAAQSGGDFMDVHHYYGGDGVGAGSGLGGHWVEHSPDRHNTPFGRFAAFSLPGKPLTASELGNNPPKTYRSSYLIGLAAVASFQGWDSFTGFAWSQIPEPSDSLHYYQWESDPMMVGSFGIGALVFRRGDVSPAKDTVVINVPESELDKLQADDFGKQIESLRALNAAVEEHKVLTVLPGFKAQGVKPIKSYDVDSANAYVHPGTELKSDTGELWRDWKIGVGTINSPRTQAAYGRLGESQRAWTTAQCTFDISTPYAAVALSSLDGAPIASSKKMLLVTLARAQATGQAYNMERNKIKARGTGPILAEPVVGTLTVKTTHPALLLHPINVDGTRGKAIRIVADSGQAKVPLKRDHATIYYEIEGAAK